MSVVVLAFLGLSLASAPGADPLSSTGSVAFAQGSTAAGATVEVPAPAAPNAAPPLSPPTLATSSTPAGSEARPPAHAVSPPPPAQKEAFDEAILELENLEHEVSVPVAEVLAELPVRRGAAWRYLWIGLFLLLFFRGGSRLLLWRISPRRRTAQVLARLWPVAEVVAWLVFVLFFGAALLGNRSNLVVWGLAGLASLAFALWWQPARDLAAGIVFMLERPFGQGDVVKIGEQEGQVVRLRLRLVELETEDGRTVFVPYRDLAEGFEVRSGGGRIAHAVRLELDLDGNADPQDALERARELAVSSPWAMLGVRPSTRLSVTNDGRRCVEVEAYAIDRQARSALEADLLSGWKVEQKPNSEERRG